MLNLLVPLLIVCISLEASGSFSPPEPVHLGVDPPVAPNGGGPWFQRDAIRNVTALLGQTAYLSCCVRRLGNRTVSWVRHHDVHLLTVGQFTFTNDARFRALHRPATRHWTLQIKFVQHRDAGMYACQVSTSPPVSYPVHLTVVDLSSVLRSHRWRQKNMGGCGSGLCRRTADPAPEPVTELMGGPELFIDDRSTLNLTCVVRRSPQPPSFIFWKHNGKVISYDSARGGISVVTIKGDVTTSHLLIRQARASDSGRYSCQPAGAAEKALRVHVLQGDRPEAMQTGGSASRRKRPLLCLGLLLPLLRTLQCG